MTRTFTLAVLALYGLTACTNADGTLGQRGSVAWYNQSSPAQKKVYFTEVCTGYGFTDGTPEMAQCIANEHRGMQGQRQAAIAAINASRPRTCNTLGNSITCF